MVNSLTILIVDLLQSLKKEVFMEKRSSRPVHIHFNSHKEAINLYIAIEMKYFLAKLLYSHAGSKSII